jgi:hypothetical protein
MCVIFQVLLARIMKATVYRDIAPCSIVETDRLSMLLTASIIRAIYNTTSKTFFSKGNEVWGKLRQLHTEDRMIQMCVSLRNLTSHTFALQYTRLQSPYTLDFIIYFNLERGPAGRLISWYNFTTFFIWPHSGFTALRTKSPCML